MITREELEKQIKENGEKEWRSYKEFMEYLDGNYKNKEFKIIGWVSSSVRKKWFKNEISEIIMSNDIINEDLWILTRGNNYWLVKMLARRSQVYKSRI